MWNRRCSGHTMTGNYTLEAKKIGKLKHHCTVLWNLQNNERKFIDMKNVLLTVGTTVGTTLGWIVRTTVGEVEGP